MSSTLDRTLLSVYSADEMMCLHRFNLSYNLMFKKSFIQATGLGYPQIVDDLPMLQKAGATALTKK